MHKRRSTRHSAGPALTSARCESAGGGVEACLLALDEISSPPIIISQPYLLGSFLRSYVTATSIREWDKVSWIHGMSLARNNNKTNVPSGHPIITPTYSPFGGRPTAGR